MLIEAIVIKKVFMREHDQLVTLYTRELGKVAATAKSVVKPRSVQALHLDDGNRIRCELVSGRGAPIITGAQAVACLSDAKGSSRRWAACQFFLQVVDTIVYDQEPDAQLWGSLTGALADLDRAEDPAVMDVFRRRQQDLLQVLGYGTDSSRSPDEAFERIAQRHLGTLDLLYALVRS